MRSEELRTATPTSFDASNTFESTIAGRTVRARVHSLSAWFVLSLRLVMGAAFLWAGWTKLHFVAVGSQSSPLRLALVRATGCRWAR